MSIAMDMPEAWRSSGWNDAAARDATYAARDASAATRAHDELAVFMLTLPLLGATLFSKFAVPLVHVDGIGFGFPLIYLALTLGVLVGGGMRLDPGRLQFFCLMAGVLGGAAALRADEISLPSLAFLMLLHLPYVAHIEVGQGTRAALQRVFLAIATLIAVCGLAQYALQFVVSPSYVFPIENLLPASWRVTGFNMQIPIAWGSQVYRANGIFMQEPSFYSQLLAVAVLVELLGPSRLWRVALYAFAILVARSGTGLVMLAVGLPVLVLTRRRWDLLYIAVLAAPLLTLAAPYLHLDQLLARVGEFSSTHSSAYERFVGGFYVFKDSVGTDPLRLLFGYGPGSYRDVVQGLGRPAAEMALFKMVVEFGLVGALLYFGFMFFCLFSARGPLPLRLALAVGLFLNGAYNTFVHSLALALLVWPSTSAARAAGELPDPLFSPDYPPDYTPDSTTPVRTTW